MCRDLLKRESESKMETAVLLYLTGKNLTVALGANESVNTFWDLRIQKKPEQFVF